MKNVYRENLPYKINMKKFFVFALIAGLLIPLFAQTREFYYLCVLVVFFLLFLAVKRKPLTLIDMLILMILTIPLHTFRFGGEEEFIRLSEIAFIPLFFWWVALRFLNKSREPMTIRKEFLLLAVYLLINIASTTNSMFPAISIKRIIILTYLFLFTYIVTDIVNNKEKINIVIKAMILISGLSGIIAMAQSVFPQLIIFTHVPIGRFFGITFYRAGVGWHDPNYYALYLTMNAALTLTCILSSEKQYPLFKICFLLQILGLLATFSRTGFISLVLVIVYILNYFRKRKLMISALMLILITVTVIATSTLTIYKKYPFLASVVYRVTDQNKLTQQPTLIMGHRFAAFEANWAMFLDHPLLGVGPFMAMYNFQKYRPSGYKYSPPLLASHNQYLQLLSEKGIFGFIVYLGVIFIILMNINKFLRRVADSEYKTYLIGLKSAIFAYLVFSFVGETSHEVQFWLTMGLSMALLNIIKKKV